MPRRPRREVAGREALEERVAEQRAHRRVIGTEAGEQAARVAARVDREPLAHVGALRNAHRPRVAVALARAAQPGGEAPRRRDGEP